MPLFETVLVSYSNVFLVPEAHILSEPLFSRNFSKIILIGWWIFQPPGYKFFIVVLPHYWTAQVLDKQNLRKIIVPHTHTHHVITHTSHITHTPSSHGNVHIYDYFISVLMFVIRMKFLSFTCKNLIFYFFHDVVFQIRGFFILT